MKKKNRRNVPEIGFMDLDIEEEILEEYEWVETKSGTPEWEAGEEDWLKGNGGNDGRRGAECSDEEEVWEEYPNGEDERGSEIACPDEEEAAEADYLDGEEGEEAEINDRDRGKESERDYLDEEELEINYLDGEEEPETDYLDGEEESERDYLDSEEEPGTDYLDGEEEPEINYLDGEEESEINYLDGEEESEINYPDGKEELERDYLDGEEELEIDYLDGEEESEINYLDRKEEPETDYLDGEEEPEIDYLDGEKESEINYPGGKEEPETDYLDGEEEPEINYLDEEEPETVYLDREEKECSERNDPDEKEVRETDYLDEGDEELAEGRCSEGGMQAEEGSAYSEAGTSNQEETGNQKGSNGKRGCNGHPAEEYLDDGYGEEDDYIEAGYEGAEGNGTEEQPEEYIKEDTPEDSLGENGKGRRDGYAAGYRKKAADWKKRHIRKGRQKREYRAARSRKDFHYRIRHIDVADHIAASAGILILAGSIVMGTVYANDRMEAVQVASFSEVGTQMEGIAVIGESGLLAMTDAQNMKAAVAEAEAAEEAAAVKEYEEKELYEEGSIEVEMHLSSVQRDLKIKFINKETGKLIPSVPFEVTLVGADKKSYVLKDDDMDGIIYLADAEPGDCSVAMREVEHAQEYAISTESVPVTVKDTIEYKKVDVANEIKKESEVNTAAEDTKRASTAESSLTDTVGFVASTKEAAEKAAGGNAGSESKPDGSSETEGEAGTENALGADGNTGTENTGAENAVGAEGEGSAGNASGTTENSGYEEVSKENIADPAAAFGDDGGQENNGQDGSAEGEGTEEVPPSVALDRTEIRLLTNHTLQLSANVKGMEDKSVAWVSDNSAVAAVASDGTVTGVSEGTATIMVICNGDNSITAFCAVTVQTEPAADYNTKLSDKDGNALYVMNGDGTFREAVYADYYTADKLYRAAQKGQEQDNKNQGQGNQNPEQGNQSQEGQDNQEQENQPQEGQDNQEQENQSQEGQDNQEQESQPQEGQDNQVQEGEGQPPEDGGSQGQPPEVVEEYKYTGWQTIDGKTYYFDADGNKVTGEQVIQGAKYTFGQDGVLSTASGHMGIDVSRWNGNIDWNAVKNSGVSYVIIRCGYRGSTTGALIEDSMFRSNIQGASSAGLKVGIYFVTQAVNEVEAVEEASMVISLISGYQISYPVFLDVEPSGGRGDAIGKAERTAVCRAFCQTIANSGYSAGIYANNTWLNEKIDTPGLANYKIWLAQYAAEPTYTATRYDMWQYSAKGKVSGISGDTDLNISYLGY